MFTFSIELVLAAIILSGFVTAFIAKDELIPTLLAIVLLFISAFFVLKMHFFIGFVGVAVLFGILLAKNAKEELIVGRKWILIVLAGAVMISGVGFFIKNQLVAFTSLFIVIVSLISVLMVRSKI